MIRIEGGLVNGFSGCGNRFNSGSRDIEMFKIRAEFVQ